MDKVKNIMVQGTASSAGKSLVATALCRIFWQDGYSVAPFKSQNMALNSYITTEGLEMGRAQVTQAEAAGLEPTVLMNPILIKPTGDSKSQVIVNGEVWANLNASDYYQKKQDLRPLIKHAYDTLAAQHDVIVIEGAGSPAEINLKKDDFVNMGMAALADAPVLLVGDIDRGGVFASLYGTLALLDADERRRVKGIVINKFRGDVKLLQPGLEQLEKLCGVPVIGVIPWVDVDIDDEDSVSDRLSVHATTKPVDIAVVHLPHISNFTDFTALGQHPAIGVRYVKNLKQLGQPDFIILPGTKNTMSDLLWMRQCGLESAIKKLANSGTPVLGICGGYQMLGEKLCDPAGFEQGGEMEGMGLLPVETIFEAQKQRTRISGVVENLKGFYAFLAGVHFEGYEIHMGRTVAKQDRCCFAVLRSDVSAEDGAVCGNVFGSYVHGLFDNGEIPARLAENLLAKKGLSHTVAERFDFQAHKESNYDKLAETVRNALNMESLYALMGVK